jgi:hypothetical protein
MGLPYLLSAKSDHTKRYTKLSRALQRDLIWLEYESLFFAVLKLCVFELLRVYPIYYQPSVKTPASAYQPHYKLSGCAKDGFMIRQGSVDVTNMYCSLKCMVMHNEDLSSLTYFKSQLSSRCA